MALCFTGAMLFALLRRRNEALGFVLLLAAVLAGLALLLPPLRAGIALGSELLALSALPPALFAPLLKAAGIAIVVRLGSALCRDMGQSALGALLEIAGALCVLLCAAPLLRAVMEMLKEWL